MSSHFPNGSLESARSSCRMLFPFCLALAFLWVTPKEKNNKMRGMPGFHFKSIFLVVQGEMLCFKRVKKKSVFVNWIWNILCSPLQCSSSLLLVSLRTYSLHFCYIALGEVCRFSGLHLTGRLHLISAISSALCSHNSATSVGRRAGASRDARGQRHHAGCLRPTPAPQAQHRPQADSAAWDVPGNF